jgi:hypothetical protein
MRRTGLWAEVVALNDGTRTVSDIARMIDTTPGYVRATILRRGGQITRKRDLPGALKRNPKIKTIIAPPADGHAAILDRARALGIPSQVIVAKLLSVAIEVGDLDVWFPLPDHAS